MENDHEQIVGEMYLLNNFHSMIQLSEVVFVNQAIMKVQSTRMFRK